ncbi:hypothetical protein [Actinoplanes sp. NBRC 103695]|uniref:TRAFAC clade GTPase domain-containing protein n=1 Tax=Actinoplanes sp. NBRC 103695 TaxID=3032202 RepID=UPI0024A09E42|nr:hypothetical protein [Actinoplanes sp. NBRC 103695]GLY97807.1 hypothetical protein Acsp02_50610 [Actinoplanes sp. NBRC 103695]
MADVKVILDFITPDGQEITWSVLVDDPPEPPAPGLRSRLLGLDSGERDVVQRRLVRDPRRPEQGERRLDAEIAAGLRLARRYPGDDYPAILPRLIGYRVDTEEPYVLWQAVTGHSVRTVANSLDNDDIDRMLRDLLRALVQLRAAGVVLRSIGPRTVLWRDGRVAIGTLAGAVLSGTPRTRLGTAPSAPPEQVNGVGVADSRDDLWSVVVLLGDVLDHDNKSLTERLGARYAALLGDALKPRAAQRPDAATLLEAVHGSPPPMPSPTAADESLSAGKRRFDEVYKRRGTSPVPVREAAPVRQERRRRWWRGRSANRPAPNRRRDCYLCLDPVEWAERDLYAWAEGAYRPLDARTLGSGRRREDLLRQAFRRCPNPSGGSPTHYLPAAYLLGGPPINIGLIGGSGAGKTHLLAGIMREVEADALGQFGIMTSAIDIAWHDEFRRTRVHPLYHHGQTLEYTRRTDEVDFADGLVLSNGTRQRPLMFFDVAGEMLAPEQQRSRAMRFLAVMDALIFVADPARAEPDVTFEAVLDRLTHRRGPDGLLDVPSAVVVSKSDLFRFAEPVDRWIGRDDLEQRWREPRLVATESRDAYAFLHSRDRHAQLAPLQRCRRTTLHFASATGARDTDGRFPHGARPQRCAQPLVSLLDMLGALPAPDEGGAA